MALIVRAANSVASMFAVILVGYVWADTQFFRERQVGATISHYLTRVALPVYMVHNITSLYSRDTLAETLELIYIPFLLIGLGMIAGLFITRVFKIQDGRRGVIVNACSLGNIVFLGFPIAQFVLGEESIGINMTYYMANTILFWIVGTYALQRDFQADIRFFQRETIKKILSPPMLGFLAGIACVLLDVPFPQFLEMAMENISGTCSALGMIFIGSVIRETTWNERSFFRDLLVLIPYKFLLVPSLALAVLVHLRIPMIAKQSFYIMSCMPGMTQLGLMSREYGSDAPFAAAWVATSTLLCVCMLPLQIWIMELFLK